MKFFNLSLVTAPLLAFALSLGCAHDPTYHRGEADISKDRVLQTTDTTDTSHLQTGVSDHVVIRFAPGKYSLSRADRIRLGDLIESGNANMQVDKVKIAAWSDKAFPANNENHSQKDRALAESREQTIYRFF